MKVFRSKHEKLDLYERKIVSGISNVNYRNNMINTTSYSKYSMIPRLFYSQFQKKHNFYFLIIGILQCFTLISTENTIPSLLFGLFIMISLTVLKQYLEYNKKIEMDRLENMNNILVYKDGKFVQT